MKPLNDYSFIRGVCHNSRARTNPDNYLREIGYAKSIGVNSFRTWLSPFGWERSREDFLADTKEFIKVAYENDITVMPIIFNGNGLRPETLEPEWWEAVGDPYVRDLVAAVKDEPGIIMWDIMNEPSCNDYYLKCAPEQKEERWAKINAFLEHYCRLVKELDPDNAITIGHTWAGDLEPSAEWVDVISVHDYLETEELIENTYVKSKEVCAKYGKPLINSELSCLGRANPYELSIKKAYEHKVGFYVFELMIRGYWGDIHGIFYPDGTVRDPSCVTAMMGIFRKYSADRIKPNPNKEGKAAEALRRLERAMTDSAEVFRHKAASSDAILEALEWIINLLECCEMVPMYDPPRVKLLYYKSLPQEARNLEEIKDFAYEQAVILKKYCRMF